MRTYLADIIPRIQSFSRRLDETTKLTNQNWVLIDDIIHVKTVYLFETNGSLDIYENGIEIDSGSWKLTDNSSLKLKLKGGGLLLKHGFFDDHVIALKLDSTDRYAFFVNETKYHGELNTINDIFKFLESKYLGKKPNSSGLGSTQNTSLNEKAKYSFNIMSESKGYSFSLGDFVKYRIKFFDGLEGEIYKGGNSGKFFYLDFGFGRQYGESFNQTLNELYLYLKTKNNR